MKQTPKEKANELVEKLKPFAHAPTIANDRPETIKIFKIQELQNAKKCALIAVDFAEKQLIEYGNQTFELQNMDATLRDLDTLKTEIQNL